MASAEIDQDSDHDPASADAVVPLGHVVSVGGSQVVAQFLSKQAAREGQADVTVGSFLGIWNGHSLVIGALCDIALEKLADGRHDPYPTARIDLLGELIWDEAGAGRFQRGVMNYPRIGSAIVPIGHDELSVIFDAGGPNTINVGRLQQDASIGAYIDVDDMVRKHFAIFGSTGAGKSSGVALILREIMQAREDPMFV